MGRPKGSKTKKPTHAIRDAIDRASKRLLTEGREGLDQVVEAQMRAAIGVRAVRHEANGEVVYDELPNTQAAKVLLEHRFGRPKESIEVSTPEDRPVQSVPFLIIPALPVVKK